MYERYSERARHALVFARFEAGQRGSETVESGHLLLGLARDFGSSVREILSEAGLTLEQLRNEIEPGGPPSPGPSPDEVRLGDEVRQILEFAIDEADALRDREVDSEHLLLGILHAERSVAASILMRHGIRLDSTRDEIVWLRSQPPRQPGVYIAPTRRSGSGEEIGSDGHWALEGFDLRSALVSISSSGETQFPGARIELSPAVDPHARYDFLLLYGSRDSRDDRNELMRRGIETHFGVSIERENRIMDVYVLTAPAGRHPSLKEVPDEGGGFCASSMVEFSLSDVEGEPPTLESLQARFSTLDSWHETAGAGSVGDVSISNGSMEMLCSTLERALDRPVVDETGFVGRYDVALPGGPGDLAERLRDELGLVLTPERRSMTWLTVRGSAYQR